MATYYVKNSRGSRIGKVVVDGQECKVYNIHRRLKREVVFVLGILLGLLLVVGVNAFADSRSDWYSECDQAYGYVTDYYTCHLYHARGGK